MLDNTRGARGSTARWRAAARRWADVWLLAVLGYAAGILLVRYIDCGWLIRQPRAAWVAATLIAILGVWALARPHRAAWFGLKWFLFYPPTWLAGLIGGTGLVVHVLLAPLGLLHAKCVLSAPCPAQACLVVRGAFRVVVFTALLASAACIVSMLLSGRKSKSPARPDPGRVSEFERLERWIAVDEPITTVSEDMFGHADIATRIVDLIANPTTPTIGLVAPFGAGKSSIRNLVAERLATRPRAVAGTQLVTVGLWPFNTSDGAITGVLSAVTRTLAEHVNTLPLRGLEQQYLEAIEGVAGALGKLIRVTKPTSPAAVLARYDTVAVSVGLRIVLWVEDFERFAGLYRGAPEPEYIRLAPLRALLNELGDLRSFQVVLASSAADYRFDLEKLARYVINVPPPRVVELGRIVALFRRECAARYPFVDAAPTAEREQLWPDEAKLGWMAAWAPMSLQRAIGALCSNPRLFKQALRTFLESWGKLHGEVDVDEVLMMSALSVASPQIVELVNTHINTLRSGSRDRLIDDKKKASRFAEEVAATLERSEGIDEAAVRLVLSELFPGWEAGEASSAASKRPQGFSQTHTDYWLRYWSQVPPSASQSDQRMLRLIDEWRDHKSSELPQVMLSGEHPDSLEALLATRLEGPDLVRLLEEVVQAEFKTGRHNWGDSTTKGDPPALVSVWRMMLKANPDADRLLLVVREQFRAVLPSNLALAFELIYFFATQSNQVPTVLTAEQVRDLGHEFRRTVATTFTGHPGELVEALRGADMRILYWSVWGLDTVRGRKTQGTPEAWGDFAATVVDAVGMAPDVMLPQVLPFVVNVHEGIDWDTPRRRPASFTKFEWDREATERLFGMVRFEKTIVPHCQANLTSEHAQRMLEAVCAGLAQVR